MKAKTSATMKIGKKELEKLRSQSKWMKESLDLFRELYQNTPEIILAINKKGIVEQANKAAERTLKLSRKDIIGKHFTVFHPKEWRDICQSKINQAFRTGTAVCNCPYLSKDKRIQQSPTETRFRVLKSKDKVVIVSYIRDLSEIDKIKKQLKQAYDKYDKSQRVIVKCNIELNKRQKETDTLHKATVHREAKMLDLKKKIRELEGKLARQSFPSIPHKK